MVVLTRFEEMTYRLGAEIAVPDGAVEIPEAEVLCLEEVREEVVQVAVGEEMVAVTLIPVDLHLVKQNQQIFRHITEATITISCGKKILNRVIRE